MDKFGFQAENCLNRERLSKLAADCVSDAISSEVGVVQTFEGWIIITPSFGCHDE